MAFKMKGMKSFGEGTPLFQKKGKNYEKSKGDQQGPIPEQNVKLQKSENDGTWVYGRGYEGEDPKEGIKEMKATEKSLNTKNYKNIPRTGTKHVEDERINDYEERKGFINEDASANGQKKLTKQQKKDKKTLEREAEIMRDRSKNKAGKKSYYKN